MSSVTVLSAYSQIMAIFETMSPADRVELAGLVEYNGAFCWHCGRDLGLDKMCHCWNDE